MRIATASSRLSGDRCLNANLTHFKLRGSVRPAFGRRHHRTLVAHAR